MADRAKSCLCEKRYSHNVAFDFGEGFRFCGNCFSRACDWPPWREACQEFPIIAKNARMPVCRTLTEQRRVRQAIDTLKRVIRYQNCFPTRLHPPGSGKALTNLLGNPGQMGIRPGSVRTFQHGRNRGRFGTRGLGVCSAVLGRGTTKVFGDVPTRHTDHVRVVGQCAPPPEGERLRIRVDASGISSITRPIRERTTVWPSQSLVAYQHDGAPCDEDVRFF